MGVTVYVVYNRLYGILGISKVNNAISLLTTIFLGAIVYALLCYLLKIDQVRELVNRLERRLSK